MPSPVRRQGKNQEAPPILDRLVHNAYRIELKGESMRKINAGRGRRLKAKVLMYEGDEGEP